MLIGGGHMSLVPFHASRKPIQAARRRFLLFCFVLALTGAFARQAQAGPIGAFQNFSLTNSTFANGTAESFDGGLSLLFTGPNDGSGEPGSTDLIATVESAGLFQFDYLYSSLDDP